MKKTIILKNLVAAAIIGSVSVTAFAGGITTNPNAVSVSGVSGMTGAGSGSNVLNQDNPAPTMSLDDRFTGTDIEESIEVLRKSTLETLNNAEMMVYKKRNPIKGDLQNFDVGSQDDINDMLAKISEVLGVDQALFSEKDPVAKALIPIGNTGYTLPADTEINVIGGSAIQAYPLKVNDEIIGHLRVACGGYLTDDVIINNDAVSYCVTSIMTTGVSRNSGVHKGATTKLFFVGITDAYMVGKVAKVKVNWGTQPKSTVKGTLAHYNIDKVPHAVETLDFETNVTMSDGTVLAGTNAQISK